MKPIETAQMLILSRMKASDVLADGYKKAQEEYHELILRCRLHRRYDPVGRPFFSVVVDIIESSKDASIKREYSNFCEGSGYLSNTSNFDTLYGLAIRSILKDLNAEL